MTCCGHLPKFKKKFLFFYFKIRQQYDYHMRFSTMAYGYTVCDYNSKCFYCCTIKIIFKWMRVKILCKQNSCLKDTLIIREKNRELLISLEITIFMKRIMYMSLKGIKLFAVQWLQFIFHISEGVVILNTKNIINDLSCLRKNTKIEIFYAKTLSKFHQFA